MARRGRGRGKPIELFPFLAILACVIGVLTLMIAGLSMGALEIDMTGTEFALLQRATAADIAQAEELEQQGQGSRILAARARHARAELARREAVSKEMDELEKKRDALIYRHEALVEERDELSEGVRLLQDRVAKLQTEIARLRGENTRGRRVKLRGPKARAWQARLQPRFIECRDRYFVLDADRGAGSREVVPRTQVRTSRSLTRLISRVKATRGGIVILLVRQGAVGMYRELKSVCRKARVRSGELPAPETGTIDYSAFRRMR